MENQKATLEPWLKEFEKKFVTKRLQNGYTEIGGLESNVDVVREIKEFISKIISESVNRAIDKNNEENVRYYGLSQAEYEMIQLEAVFEREKEIAEEVEKWKMRCEDCGEFFNNEHQYWDGCTRCPKTGELGKWDDAVIAQNQMADSLLSIINKHQ